VRVITLEEPEVPIAIETLASVSRRAFQLDRKLDGAATYVGAALPLVGAVVVTIGSSGITAAITDTSHWESRALQTLPKGTFIEPGQLFRSVAPGWLVGREGYGTIEPADSSWAATDVLYVGKSSHYGDGKREETYHFTVGKLTIHGPAKDSPVAAVRCIYARTAFAIADQVFNHPLLAFPLSENDVPIEDERTAVAFGWVPNEAQANAIWQAINLLSGNTVRCLATEFLNEAGELIRTEYQPSSADDARRVFFHRIFEAYGRLAPGGFATLAEGFHRLLERDFPIDVVLHHLHAAAGTPWDIEAQHLVLGVHTAVEAWNRLFGLKVWIDDRIWDRFATAIRKDYIPEDLYVCLGEEMRANLRDHIVHANDTTMAWRQAQLFSKLAIDVSDPDSTRALGLRNQLLHNGYFVRRWHQLNQDERQQRCHDIERLRRLILLIVFRLVGYTGDFTSPITFHREHVEATPLPEQIARDGA